MSRNVFQYQSYLDIILDTKIDLTEASEVQVLYTKPSGATGSWRSEAFETTKIKYAVQDGDIDEDGNWKFQAYAVIDDRVALGDIVNHSIQSAISPARLIMIRCVLLTAYCLLIVSCAPKNGYRYHNWRKHPDSEPIGPYHIMDRASTWSKNKAIQHQPIFICNEK